MQLIYINIHILVIYYLYLWIYICIYICCILFLKQVLSKRCAHQPCSVSLSRWPDPALCHYHLISLLLFDFQLTWHYRTPSSGLVNWVYFQSSSSKVVSLPTWFWKTCLSSLSSHLPSIHCNKVVCSGHVSFGSQILTSEATSLHALSQKEFDSSVWFCDTLAFWV